MCTCDHIPCLFAFVLHFSGFLAASGGFETNLSILSKNNFSRDTILLRIIHAYTTAQLSCLDMANQRFLSIARVLLARDLTQGKILMLQEDVFTHFKHGLCKSRKKFGISLFFLAPKFSCPWTLIIARGKSACPPVKKSRVGQVGHRNSAPL